MPESPDARRPRALKRFGQHFLEPAWARKVVTAIDPSPDDTFLEIGPGPGAITYPLAGHVRELIAFEVDRHLAAALRESATANLRVVEGDFLDIDSARVKALLGDLAGGPVRVAGNLPYNVASPILFKLAEIYASGVRLVDASVMLQREVAERLLAGPGSKEYGVLSILIQQHASVSKMLHVPPGAFRPPPKVQSMIVRLLFHPPDPVVLDSERFTSIVQAVFTRRRKTLANALLAHAEAAAAGPAPLLEQAELDGNRRPETLSRSEFGRLADALVRLRANA